MLLNVHAVAFFNEFGASLSTLSFLIALARSFDVLTDPLMGWLTDSTRSRFGRRRVYMLAFAPLYALCLIALLSASRVYAGEADPEQRATGLVVWFGVFFSAFYLCDTGANVPHSALGPELTDDQAERNSLFYVAGLFKMLGVLVAAVMPVAVQYKLSGELGCASEDSLASSAWPPCRLVAKGGGLQATALLLGGWYVVAVLGCCAVVRERPASLSAMTPPLVPSLMATLRNGPFMALLPTWVLDQLSTTLVTTMITYFYAYVVQPQMCTECAAECTADAAGAAWYAAQPERDARGQPTKSLLFSGCRSAFWCGTSGWIGLSIVVLICAAVASQPCWLYLTRRLEKRNVWLLFNVVNAMTALLFIAVDEGNPLLCVLVVGVNGIPLGAQFLTESIVADVIDYDEFLTGVRSEGRFTIGQSLLPKMVSVPASTIPLTILVVLGFAPPDAQGRPQPQAPAVTSFIRAVFFGLPFFCCVLSCALKLRFPIKTEAIRRQIREGCALHAQGLPAVDPLSGRIVQPIELLPAEQREQWRLDFFYLKQLEQLYMRGSRPLIRRMRRNRREAALSLALSVALCATGLARGWVRTQRLAWLCTFSAISGGLSLCLLLLSHARLVAALDLQQRPVNKAFLARIIGLYRGESHVESVAGITTQHVGAALERWKITHAARNCTVRMPLGEDVPLDELMGLLQGAIELIDLPVVDAQAASPNAIMLKRVIGELAVASPSTPRGHQSPDGRRPLPSLPPSLPASQLSSPTSPGAGARGGGFGGAPAWPPPGPPEIAAGPGVTVEMGPVRRFDV
jgi:Na+/melibiose symporter-like transporter